MRAILKKWYAGAITLVRTLFYKKVNRKLVRERFLKPTDSISKSYKKDIKRYWGKYGENVNTDWHRLYTSRTGIEDVRYIPIDLYYYKIEPALNNQRFSLAYEDKSVYDLLVPDFKKPATIVKNVNGWFFNSHYELISLEQAAEACMGIGEVLIKPTIKSGGGREVMFIEPSESKEGLENLKNIFLKYNRDFIVQEPIVQQEGLVLRPWIPF